MCCECRLEISAINNNSISPVVNIYTLSFSFDFLHCMPIPPYFVHFPSQFTFGREDEVELQKLQGEEKRNPIIFFEILLQFNSNLFQHEMLWPFANIMFSLAKCVWNFSLASLIYDCHHLIQSLFFFCLLCASFSPSRFVFSFRKPNLWRENFKCDLPAKKSQQNMQENVAQQHYFQ